MEKKDAIYQSYINAAKTSLVQLDLDSDAIFYRYDISKKSKSVFDAKASIIEREVCSNAKSFTRPISADYKASSSNSAAIEVYSKILRTSSRLISNTCDKSIEWLGLNHSSIKYLFKNDSRGVSDAWVDTCREYALNYLNDPKINFYNIYSDIVIDMFLCGNCVFSFPFYESGVGFNRVPLYQFSCSLNPDGSVKEVFRTIKLTPREAINKYGMILPQDILDRAFLNGSEASREDAYLEINYRLDSPAEDGSEWILLIFLEDRRLLINQFSSGYPKYIFSRFFIEPGEAYGLTPLFLAIPHIRILNDISYRIYRSILYSSMPITLTTPDCKITQKDIKPGNILRILHPQDYKAPLVETTMGSGNLEVMSQYMTQILSYLDDLLDSRDMQINPINMTATQVSSIQIANNERMRPYISRLEDEVLAPIIKNTLKNGLETGNIPAFPYEELGVDPRLIPDPIEALGISFMGRAARMQRRQEVLEMEDCLTNDIGNCLKIDPQTTLAAIDIHKYMKRVEGLRCIEDGFIKSDEAFMQTMETQAQSQRENQAMQAMQIYDNISKNIKQ